MRAASRVVLDPQRRGEVVRQFEEALRRKIVGQESALDAVVNWYQTFQAGLHPPGRPIANLLFLGPTGTGKTRVVEAVAETLYGDPRALVKIDCGEFQHSHEIAKLIGSPPGYLGHRETHPLLTQEALNQWHSERLRLSLVLFDEIEKASDAVWQLLLGILDKATLTLGDNRRVDFSQAVIFMTSNLGAAEMGGLMHGGPGFAPAGGALTPQLDAKMDRVAIDAARRKFSPEFMNRIDRMLVFRTLRSEDLESILDLELGLVQQRILNATGARPFVFDCTDGAKQLLLQEGYDPHYGARHLKRAIERNIVFPLAKLISTGQVKLGDLVRIDADAKAGSLQFVREAEGLLMPTGRDGFAADAGGGVGLGRARATNRRVEFPLAHEG